MILLYWQRRGDEIRKALPLPGSPLTPPSAETFRHHIKSSSSHILRLGCWRRIYMNLTKTNYTCKMKIKYFLVDYK